MRPLLLIYVMILCLGLPSTSFTKDSAGLDQFDCGSYQLKGVLHRNAITSEFRFVLFPFTTRQYSVGLKYKSSLRDKLNTYLGYPILMKGDVTTTSSGNKMTLESPKIEKIIPRSTVYEDSIVKSSTTSCQKNPLLSDML